MVIQAIPRASGDQGRIETYNLEEAILVGMVEIPLGEIEIYNLEEVILVGMVEIPLGEIEIYNQEEVILVGMVEIPLGEILPVEEGVLTILMIVMMG